MAFKATDVKQPELAKHDSAILDLAFAMDCTGSMGSYIHQAQENIRKIAEEIVASEKSNIHMALVEYRDHPPQDRSFVTKTHDFTPSIGTMKGWLQGCTADGGGDGPEAVADALHQVLKLSWREEATKICVFISDAPPHGLATNSGDGFPNGCPDKIDPLQVTRELAAKGVTLYIVGCEPSILASKDFFMAIAHITGGQYVPLANAELLSKVIIGGAQEEISLQRLMAEVEDNVRQTYATAAPGTVNDEELASRITMQMQAKRYQSKHVSRNHASLPGASMTQQRYAEASDLMSMNMMVREAPDAGYSAPVPEAERASFHDSYDCLEEEVSHSQVARMMKKAKAKNKLF